MKAFDVCYEFELEGKTYQYVDTYEVETAEEAMWQAHYHWFGVKNYKTIYVKESVVA